MAIKQEQWKARLTKILDKQRAAAQRQRPDDPKIVSWVGTELHPAFTTLKKLLADERGVHKISIGDITSFGETLEFEVRDVFNSACIRHAVYLTDSQEGVTREVKLTVNGNEAYSPKQSNVDILTWHQDDIINDFLTAFEKWEGWA